MPGRSVGVSRRGWRPVALGALVALGVGGGAGLVLAPEPEPTWAGAVDDSRVSVELTVRDFADERAVPAAATPAVSHELVLPTGGVLGRTDCAVGATVESGTAPFVVDDRTVLVLHTGRPLWRDLTVGLRGEDVRALQDELVRLGYDLSPNGVFGAVTARAVRALWVATGAAAQSGLPFAQMIWLPEVSSVVSSCPLSLGQAVAPGDVALGLGGGLQSLTLNLDGVPVGGARTAVVSDAVTSVVPADGVVTDPAFLAAYARTRTYAAYLADPSSALTVQVRLSDPVAVVAVPPSALYGLDGSSACVLVGGTPTRVQVVASELGQSLVTADPLPGEVRVDPGQDAPACA